MDCIQFNKDIKTFIDGELFDAELNDFLNHEKTCESCAEELEVNYIVQEGMRRLDDRKASLDLASAYKDNISANRQYMRSRKRLIAVSNVFRTLSFWTLVGTAFVFLRILILGV